MEEQSQQEVGRLIMGATAYSVFLNKDGTIKEVFESGDLKVVRNDILRAFMASWATDVNEIRSYELPSNDAAQASFTMTKAYINLIGNYNGVPVIDKEKQKQLFADLAYLNGISSRIFHFKNVKDLYERQLGKIERILTIIDRELMKA